MGAIDNEELVFTFDKKTHWLVSGTKKIIRLPDLLARWLSVFGCVGTEYKNVKIKHNKRLSEDDHS